MIGWLQGTAKHFTKNGVIILTESGVGYDVEVQNIGLQNLGQKIELWIYTNVRENEIKLYGFQNLESKDMFENLLSVSGVGPKIAHLIVSTLSAQDIQSAILLGESKTFTKVPGVGKKVSERIILELSDKVKSFNIARSIESNQDSVDINNQNVKEVFDALTMLGYDNDSIRIALKDEDLSLSSKELIKICLKKIKK